MEGNGKDGEKKRGRFMGKLFKEKKEPTSQDDVDDFLRGPSDKLYMMPAAPSPLFPPPLARIDTGRSPRWPTAAEVQSSRRGRSASPKRSRKGLVVRFSDDQPEVIGEGGDEATSPVADIGIRIRAHTHPVVHQRKEASVERQDASNSGNAGSFGAPSDGNENFRPGLIRRTQTGFDSIPDSNVESEPPRLTTAGDRRSFAERVKDDLKSGEGLSLIKAQAGTSEMFIGSEAGSDSINISQRMEEVQLNTLRNSQIPKVLEMPREPSSTRPYTPNDSHLTGTLTESPAALSRHSPLNQVRQPNFVSRSSQESYHLTESPATNSKSSSFHLQNGIQNSIAYSPSPSSATRAPATSLQEAAVAVGDDALQEFSTRTSQSFTLFRLSAEAVRPLATCSLDDLTRAALWWFIKGRLQLESTIRERPSNPESQGPHSLTRQQAYTDLSKSLWLSDSVIALRPEAQFRNRSNDSVSSSSADMMDCRQLISSSLRKLAMSMKRNNILPSDGRDAPLKTGLDTSIWVQDTGNRSLLTSQRVVATPHLSEAFPLGDTSRTFFFSRIFAEAILMEDAAVEQYQCPVLISIIRNQKEATMSVIIVNQNCTLSVFIQADKSRGTTWNDVRWKSKQNSIEVNLPRGFLLHIRLSEQDFRLLWGTYDYERRTHGMLAVRDGEDLVFEINVKSVQCFEQNPPSGFPKEPQPDCQLRIFEQSIIQKAATGPRKMHRGFRLALNTNAKTKVLRGIDQELLPDLPIQFGFLRGDAGASAFLLKIEDDKSKTTFVSTFENADNRSRLHTLLIGSALGEGEDVVAKALIKGMSISLSQDSETQHLGHLEWQGFRFINYDEGDLQSNKTVLSPNLRVILDFKAGTLTDRINVGPGELKIRLDVNSQTTLKVLRQPQQDVTFAVSEAQVSRELPKELANVLRLLKQSESIRMYEFPSMQELHLFQAAMTGFEVLFDGIASSFNISRRRMVVPIYKKWDAASTRLQVVQKEKVVHLVAFFEKFSHGDCMSFTLKSTDIFETSSKSGKFLVRIVDAKFAMPTPKGEGTAIEHKFVCLDMPEYPGEHDDITIIFDTETERDLFTKSLPAPPKVASRMGSIRR